MTRLGVAFDEAWAHFCEEDVTYQATRILTPHNRSGCAAWSQGEFRFLRQRDLKKQGKSGSDVPAPREALYSCMRERGNGTDGLESPLPFSNEIRPAIYHALKRD